MSYNKDKFKLVEDPEVSGGAPGLTWTHCPLCGAKLRDASCPYCDIEYPEAKTLDDGSDLPPEEIEIPVKRSTGSGRRTKKTGRQRW